jgi:predicted secreted protein
MPITVISVDAPQVSTLAADVPIAVSVSDKNAFAIVLS